MADFAPRLSMWLCSKGDAETGRTMLARVRLAGPSSPPQGSRFARPAPPAGGLDRAPTFRLFCFQAFNASRERDRSRKERKAAAHVCSPRAPLDRGRHRLTMKQRSSQPDRRLFESGDAALRQLGGLRVKLSAKQTPSGAVTSVEMPSVPAPVISQRVLPSDAEHSVCTRKRTQECEFQPFADATGILIARPIPSLGNAVSVDDLTIR